jgi:hypothetical protein
MASKLIVAIILFSLVVPAVAQASEEEVVADFLMRPVGFVGLILGTAGFIVSLPLTVVTGGTGKVADTLVKKPFWFTFQRDFGEGLRVEDYGGDR